MADEMAKVQELEKKFDKGELVPLSDRGAILANFGNFKAAYSIAVQLAKSDLLPETYKNNPSNVVIAMARAANLGVDPFFLMEASGVVHGKLCFEGKYVTALVNSSKKFSSLRWEEGNDPERGLWAICYAKDLSTGEVLKSVPITMAMAKAEKWTNNSKWSSMPEQMLRYRSASFWARTFAPEILAGMLTIDEAEEIGVPRTTAVVALNEEEYGGAQPQPPVQFEEEQIIEATVADKAPEEKNPEPAAQPPAAPPQEDEGWPEFPPEEEGSHEVQQFNGNPDVANGAGKPPSSQKSIFDLPLDRRS